MTSSAPSRRRLELAAADLDLVRFARPALGVAVVASGLLIYHLTRGSSFSADDWVWIDTRRGSSVHTFLAPYNGHLSLIPIAIYRLMFALAGIDGFAPYRLLLLAVASTVGVVVFEYVRHRTGEFWALLVATLLLFLGPGWNDIMQPFQIAWLIAIAAGILALSLLDRRRTATDVGACILILVSISSTSVGVALAVGIAVDIALSRRRWREAWIVGLPLVLYAVWTVHYHPSTISLSAATNSPIDLAQMTTAAVAGLVGLSGVTPTDVTGLSLTFGGPLLVLAVAAVVLRAAAGRDCNRILSLAAALVTFSLMVTLARSFQSAFNSRYMYVTCVLVALIAVELARGVSVSGRAQSALGVLTVVVVVSNIGVLRSGGSYFRQLGAQTDATLGAVGLDWGTVAPGTPLTQLPLYPLTVVTAGQYFASAHALGTPAFTIAELQRASPAAQLSADAQLISDGDVQLAGVAGAPTASGGAAPPIETVVDGTAGNIATCVRFVPAAALAPGAVSAFALGLRPGRVSVSAGVAPVTISVRRFAPAFTALGTLPARGSAIVSVSRNRAPLPWHLEIQSVAPVRVCTVGGT